MGVKNWKERAKNRKQWNTMTDDFVAKSNVIVNEFHINVGSLQDLLCRLTKNVIFSRYVQVNFKGCTVSVERTPY